MNDDRTEFDQGKIELIKRTVARGATNDELELFLHQAARMGLDPLAKQIVFQKFNTKAGPQVAFITSIDGYRIIADRTGRYAGNDEPAFDGTKAYYDVTVPERASVTVWKMVSGQRVPFTSTAHWNEYCPSPPKDHMWKRMPHVMLAKCAEAAALRKAFPADLSGVYTRDEMEQAEDGQATLPPGGMVGANSLPEPRRPELEASDAPEGETEPATAGNGAHEPPPPALKYQDGKLVDPSNEREVGRFLDYQSHTGARPDSRKALKEWTE